MQIAANYQQNLDQAVGTVCGLWKPPATMTVTEWAEANRILSGENCALPGPYRVSITPYLKEPLDCITDPAIEKLVMQKSVQVAWTDGVVNNTVGYYIDQDPSAMLTLFPTEGMAQRYSKEKLAPMIRDSKPLREKVADPKSRDSGNTILSKNFPGGHLELVGSNSPVNLASSPIRIVLIEEPDRCASNSGGEGNSLELATKRSLTFYNRKIIVGGSPTIAGESEIEREMLASDQRNFELPCPDCNGYQVLMWANVIWDKAPGRNHLIYGDYAPETARYRCDCGHEWSNAVKNMQLSKGTWRATAEFAGTAGFYISELYSPFPKATLSHIAAEFLKAKKKMSSGDPTLMITFINTALGETWEEKGEGAELQNFIDRKETYLKSEINPGVLVITAAVDIQDDRIEIEILGHGIDDETWSLEHIVLQGDPDVGPKFGVWKELDEVRQKKFKRKGVNLQIACMCIDSGDHTHAVYQYVRPRQISRVYAVKGMSTEGNPIVGNPSKKSLKKGIKLYPIGTDTAKSLIYSRIKVESGREGESWPGYCHFPDHYPDEYFEQLNSEKQMTKYVKGRPVRYYKKMRQRNEALDLRVYNLAALIILNPDFSKIIPNLEAAERRAEEKKTVKKQAQAAPVNRRPQNQRRKNFVTDF